jgi:glycerol-3-phosphate dehydrogenase subunit B
MKAAASTACDLCIVGSGMAGLSAALFAARRGLSTVVVGRTGEIIFATGFIDLLAAHAPESGEVWMDPWACLAALVDAQPRHPYARIPAERIRSAVDQLVAFLAEQGLPYAGDADRNVQAVTSVGTLKTTYRVPVTAWNGVAALGRRSPCLIVDIQGLKGFSARQVAATLGDRWPEVRTARLSLPGVTGSGEVFPERLARSLEVGSNREAFAAELRLRLGPAAVVGLPAVLGVSGSAEVLRDLETRLGVSVFEIPTMPPGVTGLRLKEAFERGLKGLGVTLCLESKVARVEADPDGGFRLHAGPVREAEEVIAARAVILATGRFMGGGLRADRRHVSEPLFHLPVSQPARRDDWHREDFLDRRGHPINRAGVEVDAAFRPVDAAGRVVHPQLRAAGLILAHQDWMRMKCGSGLAIATAWAAVDGLFP